MTPVSKSTNGITRGSTEKRCAIVYSSLIRMSDQVPDFS